MEDAGGTRPVHCFHENPIASESRFPHHKSPTLIYLTPWRQVYKCHCREKYLRRALTDLQMSAQQSPKHLDGFPFLFIHSSSRFYYLSYYYLSYYL